MTHVLALPATLDAHAIDALAARFAEVPGDERLLVDASQVRSADPFGMLGLLVLGQAASEGRDRPVLVLPETRVGATRFASLGFDVAAREVFAFEPPRWNRSTGGWGPITPLRSHEDVLRLIDGLSERAGEILTQILGYRGMDAILFLMVLSEVCQNLIEHAEGPGWVAIQAYRRLRAVGGPAVVLAVSDVGQGFRGSLQRDHAAHYGERWSDATALEAAFVHGVTRFRDPGRGQGLKQIRRSVARWGGRIAIRSGTARISDVPPAESAAMVETGLAPLPGAQVEIVLPERVGR